MVWDFLPVDTFFGTKQNLQIFLPNYFPKLRYDGFKISKNGFLQGSYVEILLFFLLKVKIFKLKYLNFRK